MMKNKYSLTVEQNIFVAKRNIVDYIWKSARLEGIDVTYPEAETICNGISVAGMRVDEILAINNLKHAWMFVLGAVDCPTNYSLICEINRKIGGGDLFYQAGYIRDVPVSIGGTSWKPDMPIESQIKEQLCSIFENNTTSATDKALTLMLYCMRKQMFLDGNKRTAMLAANHYMIKNGVGIITIPVELQSEFTKMLIKYYESGDMNKIKTFLYDNCIDGITFPNKEKHKDRDER